MPYQTDPDEPTRRLAVDEYWAPTNARIEDGRLLFRPFDGWRRIKPTVEMFTQFVKLSQANSDKEVLKYVKKWGPLLKSGELVFDYVARARAAGAILNISEKLEAGAVGNPEDWEVLDQQGWLSWYLPLDVKGGRRSTVKPQSTPKPKGAGGSFVPWPPALRRQQQRILIASYINAWLIVGEVRPALLWKSQQPTLNLAIAGPFGALGLRLLETAAQNVITACSGCRTFFDTSTRERRPKAGQGRYCDECIAAKVPERLAKRRQVLGISKPQKKKGKAARKKRADSAPKRQASPKPSTFQRKDEDMKKSSTRKKPAIGGAR